MSRYSYICWLALSLLASPVLAQNPSYELDKVEIHAKGSQSILGDSTMRTMIISAKDIQMAHAKTLEDALRFTPGVDIKPIGNNSEGGSGISIQGLDPSQVLILVDGNPVPPNSGEMLDTVDISQVLVGNVESIEIIQGGASAIYGANAMGGVVNIITQNPNKAFSFSADLSAGGWGAKSNEKTIPKSSAILSASSRIGNLATQISANLVDQNGYDTDDTEPGTDGWHGFKNNYSGKIQYFSNQGNTLTFSPSFYRAETATYKISQNINKTIYESMVTRKRDTMDLSYQGVFNSVSYNLHAMAQSYEEHIDNNADDLEQESKNRAFDVSLSKHFSYDHLVTLLVESQYEYLNQYNISKQKYEVENKDKRATDISLSDLWLTGDGFEVTAAVRANNDEMYGTHVSPMLSTKFSNDNWFSGEFNLRASIADGYKKPSLKHLYWDFDHSSSRYFGSIDLQPETSLNTQIGFEFLSNSNSRYEVNLFKNDINNLIGTKLNPVRASELGISAVYEYTNIKKAKTQGLDLSYSKSFDSFTLNLGYSFLDAINQTTGKFLPEKSKHQFQSGINSNNYYGITASLNLRYYSKQYIDFDNKDYVKAFSHADLKFNFETQNNGTYYLGIDNIFDATPDEFTTAGGHSSSNNETFTISPRYIYLGLRIEH